MSTYSELEDYIKKARAVGMGDAEIRDELLKIGWKAEDIDEAILPPPPPPAESLSPVIRQREPVREEGPVVGQLVSEKVPHPTTERTSSQETQKNKPKSRHIGLIIVTLALILIAGAVYAFLPQIIGYIEGLRPLDASNTPSASGQVMNTTEERAEISTDGWQTYRNEEYGFEVKIPDDYSVHIDDEYPRHFDIYPTKYLSHQEKYAVTNSNLFISVLSLREGWSFRTPGGVLKYDADLSQWYYLSNKDKCPRDSALWLKISTTEALSHLGDDMFEIQPDGQIYYNLIKSTDFSVCPGEPVGDDGGDLLVYYVFTKDYKKVFEIGLRYSIYPSPSDEQTIEEHEAIKTDQENQFKEVLHGMAGSFSLL